MRTKMTTYYKLVKGATKIKMAPPKQKYIDPILLGTADDRDFKEIVSALSERINDSAWTIVFKSLAVAHVMVRDGNGDIALKYFSQNEDFFELKGLSGSYATRSGDIQALERYANYLRVRSLEYRKIRKDYVRGGTSELKKVSGKNSKKCLEDVESLEVQIGALIKNRYSQYDLNNDLVMYAFRMLVQDLLALYNSLNEGIITLLESFFELTHANAERTLKLYKRFVQLTENVVRYLKTAKAVGLKIPVIKHITTKLISSLEEHLKEDSDPKNSANFSPEGKTNVQSELDRIREQRMALENQMKRQSTMGAQTAYNPFDQTAMTLQSPQFDDMRSQVPNTSNPFMQFQHLQTQQQMTQQAPIQQLTQQMTQPATMQQLPQQITQPATMPQLGQQLTQPAPMQQLPLHTGYNPFMQDTAQPMQAFAQPQQQPSQYMQQNIPQPSQLNSAVTGMQPATNLNPSLPLNVQLNPAQYSQTQLPTDHIAPMQTGPNNPFSFENVQRQQLQRQNTNPFSIQNYQDSTKNPFSLMQDNQSTFQNQQRATTFGGLERLPTVPVFPQTQLQQGFQGAPNQRALNEPNLIDI